MERILVRALLLFYIMSIVACDSGGGNNGGSSPPDEGEPAAESIVLKWAEPTVRADNTYIPSGEIKAYGIYVGDRKEELKLETIVNMGETQYEFKNLDSGLYYFAVTAFDLNNMESDFSDVVSIEN